MKEQILTFLRHLLMAIGAFFLGKEILHHTVDENILTSVISSLAIVVSGIWSWIDKELDAEKKMAFVKSLLAMVGGFIVSVGWVDGNLVEQVSGLLTVIFNFILSAQQKSLNADISARVVDIGKLKKAA